MTCNFRTVLYILLEFSFISQNSRKLINFNLFPLILFFSCDMKLSRLNLRHELMQDELFMFSWGTKLLWQMFLNHVYYSDKSRVKAYGVTFLLALSCQKLLILPEKAVNQCKCHVTFFFGGGGGGNLATDTWITVHHHGKDGDSHWCLTHYKFTQNVLLYFLEKNDYTATGAQINLIEYLCFRTSQFSHGTYCYL